MEQPAFEHQAHYLRLFRPRWPVVAVLVYSCLTLAGCQIPYLVKSAYYQADLLRRREPIAEALKSPNLNAEEKRKLALVQEARTFAEGELGLKATKNYTSFVQLDRPYVTYVVSAAERNELKPYLWSYPMLGELPYKGFFNPEDAKVEGERLKAQGYDVFVRGVSAYSTLGWFNDPILSSMLSYRDFELVDTIIHETVHATIYIKSEADFNERLAVFFGDKGAEAFYRKREGEDSATLKEMVDDAYDTRLFSTWMSEQMKSLEGWYAEHRATPANEVVRKDRLKQIQVSFARDLRPKLRAGDSYHSFENAELNNARLLNYRLYFENLSDFEAVFIKLGRDYHKMLDFCKTLEKSADPKAELSKAAGAASTGT